MSQELGQIPPAMLAKVPVMLRAPVQAIVTAQEAGEPAPAWAVKNLQDVRAMLRKQEKRKKKRLGHKVKKGIEKFAETGIPQALATTLMSVIPGGQVILAAQDAAVSYNEAREMERQARKAKKEAQAIEARQAAEEARIRFEETRNAALEKADQAGILPRYGETFLQWINRVPVDRRIVLKAIYPA